MSPDIRVRKDATATHPSLPWSIYWTGSEGEAAETHAATGEVALSRVRRILAQRAKRAAVAA